MKEKVGSEEEDRKGGMELWRETTAGKEASVGGGGGRTAATGETIKRVEKWWMAQNRR